MAPPDRSRIGHSDVMMLLPDRVGRRKHRLDKLEDVHVPDLYATQTKQDQMLRSLDDRFADHEARLLELHSLMARQNKRAQPITMSRRGPGTEASSVHKLFQTNAAVGDLELRPTSIKSQASRGDADGSFVLEDQDGVEDVVLPDVQPPGGESGGATEKTHEKNVANLTNPLARDVLDTIAHVDAELTKLNLLHASLASRVETIDVDLQQTIPATHYATKNVDRMMPTIKNIEDSLTLVHKKVRSAERAIDMAQAFEVLDDDTQPSTSTTSQPNDRAMLGDSPPQHGSGALDRANAVALRELGESSKAQADAITSLEAKTMALTTRTTSAESSIISLAEKVDSLLESEAQIRSLIEKIDNVAFEKCTRRHRCAAMPHSSTTR